MTDTQTTVYVYFYVFKTSYYVTIWRLHLNWYRNGGTLVKKLCFIGVNVCVLEGGGSII